LIYDLVRYTVVAREIIRLQVIDSTNTVALAAGEKGAAAGTVVVAESQTGGRGRLKRSWLSPPGMGLYFSLLLRPHLAAEDLAKITLAAGLAICKTVEIDYGLAPQIKWPNDLLLQGLKFAGILTESSARQNTSADNKPLVVVGAGLNLFPPDSGFPANLKNHATCLSLHTAREISVEKLLQRCVASIEEEVACLEKGDFAAILEEWRQRDAIGARALTWVTPKGEKVTGKSLGPDADGMLQIRDQTGVVHTVISGDVKLVGKV